MIKTTRDYIELVQKLEKYSQKHPKLYKLKVNLLCNLSYAIIFGTIVLSLLLIAGIVSLLIMTHGRGAGLVIKLLLIPMVLIVLLIKSMWIKFSEPYGIPITKKEHPELFKLLENLRKDLKAPKIDKVVIDYIFNAYITQQPRFGLLGIPKNYLVIGLPVLSFLNHNEFKSILAHEIAHISRKHGTTGSRVYMVQSVWEKFLKALETDNNFSQLLFKNFAEWYLPYLKSYAFIISRNHEYEADKLASEAAGQEATSMGLVKVHVIGSYVDTTYWNNFLKKAIISPDCPKDAINQLLLNVTNDLTPSISKKILQKALASKSETYMNIHPSLSDRIKAIGGQVSLPEIATYKDAEEILKPSYESIIKKLNDLWYKDNEYGWQKNYLYFNEIKDSMVKLEQKAQEEKINIEEAWEFAAIKHIIDGKHSALPLYEVVLEFNPDHIEANYRTGKIILENGDANGFKYMEKVLEKDEQYKEAAFWDLYSYYNEIEDLTKANEYFQKYLDAVVENDLADNERKLPIEKAILKKIDLDNDYILRLTLLCKEHKEIKKAYIAQREFKYFPNIRQIIFGIELDYGFMGHFQKINTKILIGQKIVNAIASTFPYPKDYKGTAYIYSINYNKIVKDKLLKIPESLIYERMITK